MAVLERAEPNLALDTVRGEALALRMVSWLSETGTAGEAEFTPRFVDLLKELPYFRDNPQDIRLVDSHNDPLTRSIVAVVRGSGTRALALVGHFDTVSTANYHELQPLAGESLALRDALIASLSARERGAQEDRALQDLVGGDFLPGRGMLDMKSGIAAAVVCLEHFMNLEDRQGNLVLMITPDEERESRGMRSLRNALPELMADLGLTLDGAINMDVTSDQEDGKEGRAAYAGTIGKLLPFALVLGQSAHASYPFEGISSAAIAAAILTRIEGNAQLADSGPGEVAPPPICLEAKDLRDGYEITTPERFWLAFNWLYCAMDASDLFARFCAEVSAGAHEAMRQFLAQSRSFAEKTQIAAAQLNATPELLTLDDLKQRAKARVGEGFEDLYAAEQSALAGIDNPLDASRRLADWLVDRAHLRGPAVVVGFAGLHYPATSLNDEHGLDTALRAAVDAARAEVCNNSDRTLVWRPKFQGVSDMSFLGQSAPIDDVVARNTPIDRLVDRPPPNSLRYPAVNIGPWGREFHQKLERVHVPYAFAVLPEIVSSIVRHYFSASRK